MVEGELASMKAIYDLGIDFGPVPIACGTYKSNPSTQLFLSSFQDFAEKTSRRSLVLRKKWPRCISEAHHPPEKFGFAVTTPITEILLSTMLGNASLEDFLRAVSEKNAGARDR